MKTSNRNAMAWRACSGNKLMGYLSLILFTIPFASFSQKGIVSGNIFYKYNDFVGNRADAGSTIKLINTDNPEINFSAIADVQGNYSINNVDSGHYLLIIKSKGTNEDPIMSFKQLQIYDHYLGKIDPAFAESFETSLKDSINTAYTQYLDYTNDKKAKFKKIIEMKMDVLKLVYRYYIKIPYSALAKLDISSPNEKIEIYAITVKDGQEVKKVTDFGITFN